MRFAAYILTIAAYALSVAAAVQHRAPEVTTVPTTTLPGTTVAPTSLVTETITKECTIIRGISEFTLPPFTTIITTSTSTFVHPADQTVSAPSILCPTA